MKKRSNGIVILLSILIVICLACGSLGLYANMTENIETDKKDNNEYKVAYRYFIDSTEVNKPVKQDYLEEKDPEFEGAMKKIPMYSFDRYTCTNNVKGKWNEDKWEFTPKLTANTTCRLYFVKNIHEVTFKANNGKLPNNELEQKINVEIDKEGVLNIIPNDGYSFDKVDCTNAATAEYDENTKDLKVKNVKKDSVCTISFKIKEYTVEVRASNGTVTEGSKKTNYGNNVEFNVTPSENYRYETVTCTNNQNATYADGKVIVNGVSNDTVCTVQFVPIKYTVTLTLDGAEFVEGVSSTASVSEGQKATFAILRKDGYTGANAELTCGDGVHAEFQSDVVYVYDVRKNINCSLKLKKQ